MGCTYLYFSIFPDDIIPLWTVSGIVMGRRGGLECELCDEGGCGLVSGVVMVIYLLLHLSIKFQ